MCTLYLLKQGTKARKNGGRIVIEQLGKKTKSLPLKKVGQLVVGEGTEVTTSLLRELMILRIPVSFVDYFGNLLGQLEDDRLSWQYSKCQMDCFQSEERCLVLTRHIIGCKLNNQWRLLKSYAKNHPAPELDRIVKELNHYRLRLHQEQDKNKIRGIEGLAAKKYFSVYHLLIDNAVWHWTGRNRRPPRDPVNALLSYGYAFLEREVRLAIVGARLDGRFGFLHSNNGHKDSLVFDLIELFRQPVIDRIVLKALNLGQFIFAHFTIDEDTGNCRLSEKARQRWIEIYEKFMNHACAEMDGHTPRVWIRQQVAEFSRLVYAPVEETFSPSAMDALLRIGRR